MAFPAPARREIITAYRHLSQLSALASHDNAATRWTLQRRLRVAFKLSPRNDFDALRVRNTLILLRNAAEDKRSLEARLVNRLAFVWWWDLSDAGVPGPGGSRGRDLQHFSGYPRRRRVMKRLAEEQKMRRWQKSGEAVVHTSRMDMFRQLVRMLNESMGTCLR